MSNENLNSDFHWKSKLENLESLPGETFNKEASWEKLHNRLQKKSGNTKAWWYWAAAACLLLALFTPWGLSNKKENILVKNNPVQNKIQPSSPLLPVNNNRDIPVAILSKPVEKKSSVRLAENHNKIITSINNKTLTVEKVSGKKDKEEFIEPEIINKAIALVDTQLNIVAIVPWKKKLRVVHINELGSPVEEPSAMAHKTETHSFQLKLPSQEVFVNTSGNSRSTGFTILTIKNSPN